MKLTSITAFLSQMSFEKPVIENFVDRLDQLGFVFDSLSLTNNNQCDIQQHFLVARDAIVDFILAAPHDAERTCYLKYEDTFLSLMPIASPKANTFSLLLKPGLWHKKFTHYLMDEVPTSYYEIDKARYARLMLSLTQPYALTSFDIIGDEEYLETLPHGTLGICFSTGDDAERHVPTLIHNIMYNKVLIADAPDEERLYALSDLEVMMAKAFYRQSSVEFFTNNQGVWSKVRFEYNGDHYPSMLYITPVKSYAQKFIGAYRADDVASYVRLILGMCEDFDIKELKTNL